MNEEQRFALEKIREGKNVFLTGPGGTGKSFFIEELRNDFAESGLKIAITALTGCAAILLGHGAKTLHSWAGIGLGKGSVGDLVAAICRNRKAAKNWMTTQLLIIDEISMMSAELFEKLDGVAKVVRRSSAPFGGLQLLLVGDFYQLPPVVDSVSEAQALFCFESPSWAAAVHETVILKQIHRQTDADFKNLLEHVRVGNMRSEDADMLRSRMGLDWDALEIRPTLLFARRAMVDKINSANLGALSGETITWKAKTLFTADDTADRLRHDPEELTRAVAKFDMDGPYDETLTLKDRAQVMLITNLDLDRGLVNGSRGIVVGFDRTSAEPLPIVQFLNGQRVIINRHSWGLDDFKNTVRSQIPLRLAWAGTIHKSQGATLDCALIDIGRTTFEYGQAYVALSRVKSLESLYIHDFAETSVKAHPKVKAFYETMTSPGGAPK